MLKKIASKLSNFNLISSFVNNYPTNDYYILLYPTPHTSPLPWFGLLRVSGLACADVLYPCWNAITYFTWSWPFFILFLDSGPKLPDIYRHAKLLRSLRVRSYLQSIHTHRSRLLLKFATMFQTRTTYKCHNTLSIDFILQNLDHCVSNIWILIWNLEYF